MAKEKDKIIQNPEDRSLKFTLPVTAASYLVFFLIGLLFVWKNIPITNKELGYSLIIVSAIVPFVILCESFFKRFKADAERLKHKFNLNYWFWRAIIISFAYTLIFLIVGIAVAIVVALTFKGFQYQALTYAIWPALAVGFWTYYSINLGKNFRATDMVNIIGIFLIGGVTLSAIFNPNPQWWNESISYLGMYSYKSATILNISLILSGLLLLTLSSFINRRFNYMYETKMISERSNKFLKLSFILAPIGLACVGIFPYEPVFPREQIHNFSAFGAFGLFAIIILLTYWLMPFFSKYYLRLNYVIFALLAGIFILNLTGYLTLALTETMAFGIIAVWLLIFLRSIDGILDWNNNDMAFK